ncbi:uncharacterized protein [Argopecten irradians]|uniref:uncharacterized protein n=1 Tax=Argopecten irradians TaxID=31199 RepID=UPI003717BC62
MAAAYLPIRVKGQSTCVHHKGKQLDFYCEKCQELMCSKCLSSVHKGHVVCELGDITPQKKQEIQNFITKTEQNDLVQIGTYIASTETLLKENDSTFEKLSNQLKIQTDKLKQDLDKLTAETLSLYQEMRDDNTKLIQKYKQDLELYDNHLKQLMQDCKKALQQGSHLQVYDTACEIHSPRPLPVKPVLGTASFTPNINPQGHLEQAIGKVITTGQSPSDQGPEVSTTTYYGKTVSTSPAISNVSSHEQHSHDNGKNTDTKKKLLPETKLLDRWESPCKIDSICPTTANQAWTYNHSKTITLLDRKGTVVRKINHSNEIITISLSPTTQRLWVCDYECNIMELVSQQLTHRFNSKNFPWCMCVTANGHVIAGMPKHISKFTTQGQVVITTLTAGTGKSLVCSPRKITECPVTHNVAVFDDNSVLYGGDQTKCVVVIDENFNKLFVYRGDIPPTYEQQLSKVEPCYLNDVAYDSVGNLIIGVSQCIVLLNGGGEFLRLIHRHTSSSFAVGKGSEDVLWVKIGKCVKLLQYSKE